MGAGFVIILLLVSLLFWTLSKQLLSEDETNDSGLEDVLDTTE